MRKVNLLDIMNEDGWRDLQESIARITGAAPLIIQKDGSQIFPQQYKSEACRSIRATAKGLLLCRESNKRAVSEVMKKQLPVVKTCHIGFTKIAVPIMVRNNFLGIAGGCMFLRDSQFDEDRYRAIAKKFGLDELELIRDIREMDEFDIGLTDKKIELISRILQLKIDSYLKKEKVG